MLLSSRAIFHSFESGEDTVKIYVISQEFKFHNENKNERFMFKRIQPRLYQQMCQLILKHAVSINLNEMNIQNENSTKEKENNSISMNL